MPLHISEIGVHMAVRDPEKEPSGPPGPAAGGCGSSPGGMTPAQRDTLVDDCVRTVLRLLHMQKER
jgi:hypothetical protein